MKMPYVSSGRHRRHREKYRHVSLAKSAALNGWPALWRGGRGHAIRPSACHVALISVVACQREMWLIAR